LQQVCQQADILLLLLYLVYPGGDYQHPLVLLVLLMLLMLLALLPQAH
jgi:hypothetical protein